MKGTSVPQFRLGALTLCAMGFGSIVPFALAALAPFVIDELGWSRTLYGTLITMNFATGMLFSTRAGKLADATSGPSTALIILFVTSAMALLTLSVGANYAVMAVGAALGGMSMSNTNPSTNKLVSAFAAVEKRGLIIGVKQSGVQLGTLLCGVALPPLASFLGWRGSLRVAAMVAMICAIATAFSLPSRWPPSPSTPSIDRPLKVGWLRLYAFLMGGGIAAATYYLPLFAHERLGYAESGAGIFLSAIGATGIVSRVLAGHLANRVRDESRMLILMAATAIGAVALVWSAETYGTAFLWAGALLLGASAVAWNAVVMLSLIRKYGFESAGRSSSMVSSAFYGGLIVMPTVFGMIVDGTESYAWGWFLSIVLFGGAVVVVQAGIRSEPARMAP